MRIKIYFIVQFLLFLFFFKSCEFYEEDYRVSYIGNYHFRVVTEHWEYGTGIWHDTTWYDGEILFYDSYLDAEALRCYEDSIAFEERITIHFLPEYFIASGIDRLGNLTACSGYHYYHEGGFISKSEIKFEVKGLGGLGKGWNYEVYGKRRH